MVNVWNQYCNLPVLILCSGLGTGRCSTAQTWIPQGKCYLFVTQVNLLTSRLPLPCVISTGVGWWDARKLLIQLLDLGVIQQQGFVLLAFALSLGEVEGGFWAVLVGISWDWVWADLHTTSWPQLHWRAGLDANKGGSQDVVFFFFFSPCRRLQLARFCYVKFYLPFSSRCI